MKQFLSSIGSSENIEMCIVLVSKIIIFFGVEPVSRVVQRQGLVGFQQGLAHVEQY